MLFKNNIVHVCYLKFFPKQCHFASFSFTRHKLRNNNLSKKTKLYYTAKMKWFPEVYIAVHEKSP